MSRLGLKINNTFDSLPYRHRSRDKGAAVHFLRLIMLIAHKVHYIRVKWSSLREYSLCRRKSADVLKKLAISAILKASENDLFPI